MEVFSLNIEEERQMAILIPTLRKKELVSKLSMAEQRELDKMIERYSEMYPDMDSMQYATHVKLNALRNFTIVDTTPRPSLFQKMLSKENPTEYRLQFADETTDVAAYDLDFTMAITLRQVMEEAGLELDWSKMLPVEGGMRYTDPLEEADKAWFEAFPNPTYCLGKLQDTTNLKEKAITYGTDIIQVIQWLEKQWASGYQIYADIDPELDD